MLYINNTGLKLVILSQHKKQCVVKFLESGSTRIANIDNIKVGKVKDLYAPSRYGVGYDGDFIKCLYWKKAKDLWSNMLKRCYCRTDKKGYYGKCIVAPRWHCFSNFLSDLPMLPRFKDWELNKRMELDKDELGDSTVYSREVCQFCTGTKNRQLQYNYRQNRKFCKGTRTWK